MLKTEYIEPDLRTDVIADSVHPNNPLVLNPSKTIAQLNVNDTNL